MPNPPRILLLLDHPANQRLLADYLGQRYHILGPDSDPLPVSPFDLAIVDKPALMRLGKQIQVRKAAEQPLFLPFLLVVTRPEMKCDFRAAMWHYVDEAIIMPVEKVELHIRVEMLVRVRQFSLDIKRRNEDLEAFMQAMTHDLRGPTRIVSSFVDILLEDHALNLNEEGQHYLHRIGDNVGQMQTLIDILLDFARLGHEATRQQLVSLPSLIESCRRDIQDEAQGQDIHIILEGDPPLIVADSDLMRVALTNLLSNAYKYVAPGVQPHISISVTAQSEMWRIQVQDNGLGLAVEDQVRIFSPFVRLHGVETYPGFGLGLAAARKAVELMGGRIGVISTLSQGSTFWIELPIKAQFPDNE